MAIQHIIGIDDAPFSPDWRGDVTMVGAVFNGIRLEGVLTGRIRRDGANATGRIAEMVGGSRYVAHLQLIMLQGIALAGFNVVDIQRLHRQLGIPVMTVARGASDGLSMRHALLQKVPGGARKWRLARKAGPLEPIHRVWVQRAGLDQHAARQVLTATALNSHIPEPLRTAHLIASALGGGSRRRV